ncbi:Imm15 family immunity protein [Neisseria zalophi]|uniref:Uncharacterized protein n=1 Tax=Neisseria zalophi TaxID=640030 RepID=A0A5J6Q148_9NEIS|nr:Imm15 family immunity protein [Neisseria zalophi]QEY26670.1 hypothetical protein D0T92_09110 [Neisseria zalophi]
MLTKKIAKIFKDSSIQFEELLFDYETFEEPPLIHGYPTVKKILKNNINREDLNTFLFNLALAHLNSVVLYAKNKLTPEEFANFFICLTYTDDENDEVYSGVSEFGFYMPSFWVTRKEKQFDIKNKIKKKAIINLENYPIIKKTLTDLNLIQIMDVYLESWTDQFGSKIKRFFFLYNEN